MKYVLLAIGLFLSHVSFSQQVIKNIDSALTVLSQQKADSSKAILYQEMAAHFNVMNLDSAKMFAVDGLALSRQLKFSKGEWMNLNMLGNYHERRTQYDSAMYYYNLSLQIIEAENSDKGRATVYNNVAMVNIRKGDYDQALELMFKALRAEETIDNPTGIAQAYNNIGVGYYYLKDYDKATEYLLRALALQKELGNITGLQQGYNNVGAIFDFQEKYHDAIATYEKALSISRELGDRQLEAANLANIALAYSKLKDFERADLLFEQSIAVREAIDDKNGLAHSYTQFGESLRSQKRFALAEAYLTKGLKYAENNGLKLSKRETYGSLAELYLDLKEPKKEADMLRKYIAVSDTIINETKAKAVEEFETKYETEKKEKDLAETRANLAESELSVKNKNNIIFGSLGLAIILGLLGYLFYNQQRLKNKQLTKEAELSNALAKIETQNRLQEQRLRISRDLHDNIGAQLTFIISSLDNLKFGFSDMGAALSKKLSGISSFTSDTIYELRDTIWAMNKSEISMEDLQARISNLIEKARLSTGKTSFHFNMDDSIANDRAFTSVVGMNVYRIIQEAINNSIKYAEASEISVHISEEDNHYTIITKDNGNGFDRTTTDAGNGLNNIKKRALDCKGTVEIISELGKGTSVHLEIPQ